MTKLAVLSVRPFRTLWLASVTSGIGTSFATVAFAFAVFEAGGTATTLGLVFAAGAATRLAFLLVGGVWADRLPRRQVMLACDIFRAVIQSAVAILLLIGHIEVWHLVLATVANSFAASFFLPASVGLVAQTVDEKRLQEANALLSIGNSTASIAGPAISGLLVATAGSGVSLAVDAVSFAVSALLLATIPIARTASAVRRRFVTELAEGWHELTARRWYWLNLISHGLWNLAAAAFLVLGPALAHDRLGGASAWGLVASGLSGGAVLGGLLTLRYKPAQPLVAANLALVLGALPLIALAARAPLMIVVIAAVIHVAGLAFLNGVWYSVVQRLIPKHVLSRVSSYDSVISLAVMPIGYAAVGPIAAHAGAEATLVGAALLMVLPSALAALVPSVRAVRQPPEQDATTTPHAVQLDS